MPNSLLHRLPLLVNPIGVGHSRKYARKEGVRFSVVVVLSVKQNPNGMQNQTHLQGLRAKTQVKAGPGNGGIVFNHNETHVRRKKESL